MNENLQGNDLLLMQYLDKEMDANERRVFEERLTKEPALLERLQALQIARLAVVQSSITEKVRKVHAEEMAEKNRSNRTPVRRMINYTIGVAASLLILFFAIRLLVDTNVSADQLYNEAYVDYQFSPGRNTSQLNELEQAYVQKQFGRVISITPLSSTDSLLQGLALMKNNQYREARILFESLNSNGTYQQDAQFYGALALLRMENIDKAWQEFKAIQETSGHLYQQRISNGFLKRLEKLKKR